MCGIFGVWGHQRAAALTHLGLYSLQHRGQESAGVVAVGPDGVARSVRKMGLVSEGFSAGDVANLQPVDFELQRRQGHTQISGSLRDVPCVALERTHQIVALECGEGTIQQAALAFVLIEIGDMEFQREVVVGNPVAIARRDYAFDQVLELADVPRPPIAAQHP